MIGVNSVTGISVRSVNAIFLRMRRRMAEVCELSSPFQGVVEADESYFGPRRVRGKRRVTSRNGNLRTLTTRTR